MGEAIKESPERQLRTMIEKNPDYKVTADEYGLTILRRVTCRERSWRTLFREVAIDRGKPVCQIDYWPLSEFPKTEFRTSDEEFAKYAATLGLNVTLV
jgi:hypothetical protein